MKRIYHHYVRWEDWQNGLYRKQINNQQIDNCIELLSNHLLLQKTMIEVINNWPYSTEHNLTDKSINRQAWLGQSSCCLIYGVSHYTVRIAWRLTDNTNKIMANRVADSVISLFESRYKKVESYGQKTFGF